MHNLIHVPGDAAFGGNALAVARVGESASESPLLIEVLWRRRWTLAAASLACVGLALLYLLVATPVYRATSMLVLKENGPRIYSDPVGYSPDSDSHLQTQADVIKSAAVLNR